MYKKDPGLSLGYKFVHLHSVAPDTTGADPPDPEPGQEAVFVEDVAAGKLLVDGVFFHLRHTYGTQVCEGGQLLAGGVREILQGAPPRLLHLPEFDMDLVEADEQPGAIHDPEAAEIPLVGVGVGDEECQEEYIQNDPMDYGEDLDDEGNFSVSSLQHVNLEAPKYRDQEVGESEVEVGMFLEEGSQVEQSLEQIGTHPGVARTNLKQY